MSDVENTLYFRSDMHGGIRLNIEIFNADVMDEEDAQMMDEWLSIAAHTIKRIVAKRAATDSPAGASVLAVDPSRSSPYALAVSSLLLSGVGLRGAEGGHRGAFG